MSRFFVSKENISGNDIILSEEDIRHIRVLRIGESETFTVCDGEGTDYLCRLPDTSHSLASVLESSPSEGEPSVKCGVYAAFSKGDKAEELIQKTVQLGGEEIVLFPSARCVSRPDAVSLKKKQARWLKISETAAKQCGRGIIPPVRWVPSYESAIEEAARSRTPLFLYEGEKQRGLRDVLEALPRLDSLSIVAGPEGGFEPREAQYAGDIGMHIVTLGKRILRCETAPVAALAAIMFFSGNL